MLESLWSNLAWSILSKAFERSSSTSAVICFLSIASSILSVSRMLRVSVECARCRHKNWSFISKAKVIFYLECYKISQYNDRILREQFQELA